MSNTIEALLRGVLAFGVVGIILVNWFTGFGDRLPDVFGFEGVSVLLGIFAVVLLGAIVVSRAVSSGE